MKTFDEANTVHRFIPLMLLLLLTAGCLTPAPPAESRDAKTDVALSEKKAPLPAEGLSEITGDPQEGRFQEPDDEITLGSAE